MADLYKEDPGHTGSETLPILDIREELDEDGNIVSSTVTPRTGKDALAGVPMDQMRQLLERISLERAAEGRSSGSRSAKDKETGGFITKDVEEHEPVALDSTENHGASNDDYEIENNENNESDGDSPIKGILRTSSLPSSERSASRKSVSFSASLDVAEMSDPPDSSDDEELTDDTEDNMTDIPQDRMLMFDYIAQEFDDDDFDGDFGGISDEDEAYDDDDDDDDEDEDEDEDEYGRTRGSLLPFMNNISQDKFVKMTQIKKQVPETSGDSSSSPSTPAPRVSRFKASRAGSSATNASNSHARSGGIPGEREPVTEPSGRPAHMAPISDVLERQPPSGAVSDVLERQPPSGAVPGVFERQSPSGAVSDVLERQPSSGSVSDVIERQPPSGAVSDVLERQPPSCAVSDVLERQPPSGAVSHVLERQPPSGAVSDVIERPPAPFTTDANSNSKTTTKPKPQAVPLNIGKSAAPSNEEIEAILLSNSKKQDPMYSKEILEKAAKYYQDSIVTEEQFLEAHDDPSFTEESTDDSGSIDPIHEITKKANLEHNLQALGSSRSSNHSGLVSDITDKEVDMAEAEDLDDRDVPDMAEIARDYQNLRQKFVNRSGGYKKTDEEKEIEPIEPVKMSRFKAARLSGKTT